MLLNKQVKDTGTPAIPNPQPEPTSPQPLLPHDILEALPANCKVLHNLLKVMEQGSMLTVTIPSTVTGTFEPVEIRVAPQDCLELFRCEWLNTSVLEIWIL